MLSFVQNYTDMGFGSVILFVVIGTVLTMIERMAQIRSTALAPSTFASYI